MAVRTPQGTAPRSSTKAARLAELRSRSARIKERLLCVDRDKIAIALEVAEIDRQQLFREDGYASLTAWAWDVHEIPSSTILDARDVGRACRLHPDLHRALREERVSYSSAVAIATAARLPSPAAVRSRIASKCCTLR